MYSSDPYVNSSKKCDYTFRNTDLSTETISELPHYHIGILYDINNKNDKSAFVNLDFIIQIINEEGINGRRLMIHYTSVSYNNPSTYKTAVEELYEKYKDDLLCFIGTSEDKQREAIADYLNEIDKLLFVPSDVEKPNCYKNIIIVYITLHIDGK